jgi:rfaE bifunctional protein nucleotidyltransferase chain/domain/rfaE bifunctional protein kinase chain/domain
MTAPAPARRRAPLVVLGDTLLDRDVDGRVDRLSPEAPVPIVEDSASRARPGGAGLAACLAAADGHPVLLVTALGRDGAGEEVRALLDAAGVEVVDLGLRGPTPEKVRVRSQGRTLLRLDFGGRPRGDGEAGAVPPARVTAEALAALGSGAALLVADYGQGVTADPSLRGALTTLRGRVPVVWDPHPRGRPPVPGLRLVKPNRSEAAAGGDLAAVAARARQLRAEWRADGVVVTLGGDGALLVTDAPLPLAVPAPRLAMLDPCGAGDRFSATAAGLLADGAELPAAVTAAVQAASAFVAAGGASAWSGGAAGAGAAGDPAGGGEGRSLDRALGVAAEARARGGRVVATGGCFDLLHAGHVSTLRAARALGACLVVCLNSDASVRRLKGPDRPVVPEADRAAVLEALGCVDAVVCFDEPTPEAVLRRLRPDVFAKGGDYAGRDLPERAVLAEWGGEVVALPYLDGRSTTRLVEEVTRIGRA